jgi:hypothetical protein
MARPPTNKENNMYVVLVTNEDNETLRAYGPYTDKTDADEAIKALGVLFSLDPEVPLWTTIIKVESFNGYQYT